MRLDGRTEKRTIKAMSVSLINAKESRIAEQAVTVNVSRHGARLRTKRKWNPGERPRVVRERSQTLLQGRVVYCEPLAEGRFCVGLEIQPAFMDLEADSK
jgi:hypothetical protein